MTDLEDFQIARNATTDRPLSGVTLLLVEDSRLASEGMRLLCRRAGARLRRADTLAAADRHLRAYRPGAVVVDLHLPDGSGLDLVARLAQARPRIDAILATSGDPSLEGPARAAGADGFLPKPVDLAAFLAVALATLPSAPPPRPYVVLDPAVAPDPIALREDLEHAATLLADPAALGYVTGFLRGVARMAGDATLAAAVASAGEGGPAAARLAHALRQRLATAPAL